MTKVINTEKFATKFFTKNEIRYINTVTAWDIIIPSMVPVGCKYKTLNYTSKVVEITCTTQDQITAITKAMEKRAKNLRKYGKIFGVEYYAEQAIQYALNH